MTWSAVSETCGIAAASLSQLEPTSPVSRGMMTESRSVRTEAARELLGHSDTRTTERCTHTLRAKRQKSREALEALWAVSESEFAPDLAPAG